MSEDKTFAECRVRYLSDACPRGRDSQDFAPFALFATQRGLKAQSSFAETSIFAKATTDKSEDKSVKCKVAVSLRDGFPII